MSNFWSEFKSWYSQPFAANMSVSGWALFIGILLVLVILWTRVLNHLDTEL